MQSAHAPDGLVAGPQVEVIGVAENNFSAQRFQHVLRDGFDRAGGAHRHEDRRLDRAVRQMHLSPPPARSGGCRYVEVETHQTILTGQRGRWGVPADSGQKSEIRDQGSENRAQDKTCNPLLLYTDESRDFVRLKEEKTNDTGWAFKFGWLKADRMPRKVGLQEGQKIQIQCKMSA